MDYKINKVIEITEDIVPNNVDELLTLLKSDNGVDLFNLYFKDEDLYTKIKFNIYAFIENTKQYYSEDAFLRETYLQLLSIFGLYNHLLDRDGTNSYNLDKEFLESNKSMLIRLLNDSTLSGLNKEKIKLVSYFNLGDETLSSFESIITDAIVTGKLDNEAYKDPTILLLLFSKKHSNLFFKGNCNIELFDGNNYLNSIKFDSILSYTQTKDERDLFIKNNLQELINKGITSNSIELITPETFYITLAILIAPNLKLEEKITKLKDSVEFNKVDLKEFFENNINFGDKDSDIKLIETLYNNGVEIELNNEYLENGFSLEDFSFKSKEIELNFIKNNLFKLNELQGIKFNEIIKELLNGNISETKFFNKFDKNNTKIIDLIKEYIKNEELKNFNSDKVEKLLLNGVKQNDLILENDFILDIFKYYLKNKIYLKELLNYLTLSNLKILVKENTDLEYESVILEEIKKKENKIEFQGFYVKNLLDENDFSKNFLFSYEKIIKDLENNNTEIDLIKEILINKDFFEYKDDKKLPFIEFLISNQKNIYNKFQIFSYTFYNKDKIFNKDSSYILKMLLNKFITEQNFLNQYMDFALENTKIILDANKEKEVGFGDKIKGWFSKKDKEKEIYELFNRIGQGKDAVNKFTEKNKSMTIELVKGIDEILNFYKEFQGVFNDSEYKMLEAPLKMLRDKLDSAVIQLDRQMNLIK